MRSGIVSTISLAMVAACLLLVSCRDGYEPGCHHDCFSYMECVDGVVIFYWGSPIPCDEWTGECYYGGGDHWHICEKGCAGGGWMYEPPDGYYCVEDKPKSAGDPCTETSECYPVEQSDQGIFLDCDTDAGVCIEVPDPCIGCTEHGTCTIIPPLTPDCTCNQCYYDDGSATCTSYPESGLTCVVSRKTDRLTGVWASGPDDVWISGSAGWILHWDGIELIPNNLGGPFVKGLWGFGPRDIWAFGSHLVRFDGIEWIEVSEEWAIDLWGTSSSNMWAVFENSIKHWNGSAWQEVFQTETHDLNSIWGTAADDIMVVGEKGVILHWDGITWNTIPRATTSDLTCVWGSAADDYWAVGKAGAIVHWDGNSWSLADSGVTTNLNGVGGVSSSDVWAAGANGTVLHWDGNTWTAIESHTNISLTSVFGIDPDVWIAGETGTIFRVTP